MLPLQIRWMASLSIAMSVALATLSSRFDGTASGTPHPGFVVERMTPDVYRMTVNDVHGFGNDANTVVIVGDSGVMIVDTHFSQAATRVMLDSLRRITSKPVRWVVNTHWHDDHIAGNQAIRAAFPRAEFIAHRYMRDDLATEGLRIRTSFMGSIAGTSGFLRDKIARREGIDGKPTDSLEVAAFDSYVRWIERFAAESTQHVVVAPSRVFDDSLSIATGGPSVVLRYLGPAHTRGDIVVQLPRERIVVAGDIVLAPVPFVGTTSFPREYAATLDRLLGLAATAIVPGHGPVMRSADHIRNFQRMMRVVTTQVDSMRRAGDSLSTIRRQVTLDEFRRLFAGSDRLRNELFDNYVVTSAIPKAFRDGAAADSALRGAR